MAYVYRITIGNFEYIPIGMIESSAKIAWEKQESGLMFKKQLSGKFSLFRNKNEALYDQIMAFTHCSKGFLWVLDTDWNNPPVVVSVFTKRNIDYKLDRCTLDINPKYYDEHGIDAVIEKDYNVINENLPPSSISYNESYQFEFVECEQTNVFLGVILGGNCYGEVLTNEFPITMAYCSQVQETHTFFSQENTITSNIDPNCGYPLWNIKTVWFREVKFVPKSVDPDPLTDPQTPPRGNSDYDFSFINEVTIEGITYNKYARQVSHLQGVNEYSQNYVTWHLSDYYGNSEMRILTRVRSLTGLLEQFAEMFGVPLSSAFFYNNVNPVSGKDLTNIKIGQKSDCKFDIETGLERSDPARLGIITFRQLMDCLWAMFQVTWAIQDDTLYIEHINFFRNNFSYTPSSDVGIDLTTAYPICLEGTKSYSYDDNLPIRVKYSFMEAWNLDFIGSDIDYTECLDSGKTDSISAEVITTDIDPTYLDNEASDDGFCLFHCDENNRVIEEEGQISGLSSPNAHLSWANLHHYYWMDNSPLPNGRINNKRVDFNLPLKRLKKQVPVEFPFCVENFMDVVNDPVRTTLGDGEIVSAEYSFKTGNIKIELTYE